MPVALLHGMFLDLLIVTVAFHTEFAALSCPTSTTCFVWSKRFFEDQQSICVGGLYLHSLLFVSAFASRVVF